VAAAGVAKVAGVFGDKLKEKLAGDETEPAGVGEHERVEHADEGYGHAGVRH